MRRTCRQCKAQYAGQPGTGRCLGHLGDVRLLDLRCEMDGSRFSRTAHEASHRLMLPRSGAYLMQLNGHELFVDSSAAILVRPGDERRVAHPLGSGDTFTAVHLGPELADRWPPTTCRLPLDDATDLHHRALVAACRRGFDALAVAERLHAILDRLAPHAASHGTARPSTAAAHRRLVADAREVLAEAGYTAGLTEIAAQVNCSPHHLSRIFRAVTGQTLTEHRNRMRVRAVLSDLQDGDECLRTLAARYGFADQAHLTRVVRKHLDCPPSTVQHLLAGGRASMNVQRHGG